MPSTNVVSSFQEMKTIIMTTSSENPFFVIILSDFIHYFLFVGKKKIMKTKNAPTASEHRVPWSNNV